MARMKANTLAVQSDAELLSYIINVTPELRDNIELPVQGQSIKPIGQIIVDNERYRNAFINTVNLIGLTIIKRNGWDNPWTFTVRGTLNFGQQVRELILDLCNVYDYNEDLKTPEKFLENEVPNVLNYIHSVNFQKYYKTTTSDAQLAMAFNQEGDLMRFIEESVGMLFESWNYDRFIVDKYMLCRRILDGTMTSIQIPNFATNTERQNVSFIKNISNKMTFRSPNYNPAGIRRASSFDEQILIVNTEFEANFTTEVLATSYFRDEADLRQRLVLIDSFSEHDTARLTELLKSQYVEFTEDELTKLKTIPAVNITNEWFMDYYYALDNNANTKLTEFYNPQTLRNNHFLHVWAVFSTSPFENGVVFTSETPAVNSVTVNPATASVMQGQSLQLNAVVDTEGFANKAVTWEVTTGSDLGVTVSKNGLVQVPATATVGSGNVVVTAKSIYDKTKTGKSTISITSAT